MKGGRIIDPAQLAAELGQNPRQPGADQWGNGGASGRAGTAISWSASNKLIKGHVPGVGGFPHFEPLLLFNSPTGQPALWNISIQLAPAPLTAASVGVCRKDMAIKLRWSLGGLASEAVADVASANASFQLAADSINIYFSNPAEDPLKPTESDLVAAAAVTHASGVAAGRTARRTLYGLGASAFVIPPWAQQVQIVPAETDFAPGAYTFNILDSAGNLLEIVYVATGTTSYTLVELPSGAAQIVITSGVSPKSTIGLCFVLGF